MKKLRKLITVVVFWLLVGVSLTAGAMIIRHGMPEVDHHWTVSKISSAEFATLPDDEKLVTARRLERNLARGLDLNEQVALLPPADAERFYQNFSDLTEIWFVNKVDQYFSKPKEWRDRWLAREKGRIDIWLRQGPSTGDESRAKRRRLESVRKRLVARYDHDRLQEFMSALKPNASGPPLGGFPGAL